MKRALALIFLTACAPTAPVFKPVRIEVPIAAPCRVKPVAKPDFALSHVSINDDVAQKTKAALVELDQRRAYEAEMEARVEGCR